MRAIDATTEVLIPTYTEPDRYIDRARRYFRLKTLGSLAHIKSQLFTQYPGSYELFLRGQDNNQIQVFWIPCKGQATSTVVLCK
jgi:hypothetical protein